MRQELDDFLRETLRASGTTDLWASSALFAFISMIPGSRSSRTKSSLAQASCRIGSPSFVPVTCSAGTRRSAGFLSRWHPLYPLIPERVSLSACIEGTELSPPGRNATTRRRCGGLVPLRHGHKAESRHVVPKLPRVVPSMVGFELTRSWARMNPWRALLFRSSNGEFSSLRGDSSQRGTLLAVSSANCSASVLPLFARGSPWWRQWMVHTLEPRSIRELLSLCHAGNVDHVKVVGYNNGVVHFGHRHPRKTVISTIHCRRTVHAGARKLKADCGATVRAALDYLAGNREELYVVPNYSYVCLGTSFFVPIHGSAVDYSTVADTICRVVLFDPDSDRIFSATRDDVAFREHVYNLHSRAVVLRLYIRTRPKASYFVHWETLENPSSADILAALHDDGATNVEIRQSHAASAKVTVARYYNDLGETTSPAGELPRDALGSLWDRLEENPVTSFLMHALSKRVAWHTELFSRCRILTFLK